MSHISVNYLYIYRQYTTHHFLLNISHQNYYILLRLVLLISIHMKFTLANFNVSFFSYYCYAAEVERNYDLNRNFKLLSTFDPGQSSNAGSNMPYVDYFQTGNDK